MNPEYEHVDYTMHICVVYSDESKQVYISVYTLSWKRFLIQQKRTIITNARKRHGPILMNRFNISSF